MNKLFLAGVTAAIVTAMPLMVFAAAPVQSNCLGGDISGFAHSFIPLGKNVVTNFTSGGFGFEILAHLQGVPAISTCPDFGFPTPFPLP